MDPVIPLTLAFLGANEWAIVLLFVVLFFGAAKIPELARSLGKAKGEFEKASRESREAARAEPRLEDAERERVLQAARDLGIPTEGRTLSEVKGDLRARLQ